MEGDRSRGQDKVVDMHLPQPDPEEGWKMWNEVSIRHQHLCEGYPGLRCIRCFVRLRAKHRNMGRGEGVNNSSLTELSQSRGRDDLEQ